jgi:hypothetical protein
VLVRLNSVPLSAVLDSNPDPAIGDRGATIAEQLAVCITVGSPI